MTTLSICGDPIVGRVLMLLLRDAGYEAKLLSASGLSDPGVLKGIPLLVLTPTPELSTERRKALLTSLKDIQKDAELIVLELDTGSKERREKKAPKGSWHMVPWPCRFEELKQWIEATLPTKP